MTIGIIVDWIGQRSAWWLLIVPVAFYVVLQAVRGTLKDIGFWVWRRNMRSRIQRLERHVAAYIGLGGFYQAAWCEWQRREMRELLEDAELWRLWLGVPNDHIDAYKR